MSVLEKASLVSSTKKVSENNRNVKTVMVASAHNSLDKFSGEHI